MARAGTAYVSFDGDFGPLNRALAKKMGELKGVKADINLGVKVDRGDVRRAVAAVKSEIASKDAKINVRVDYDRAAFRRLSGDATNASRAVSQVASGFDKFATAALGVVGAMSGIGIIFADVAVGATALAAALAPLIGLLGAIPAGIVGLGQVSGALVAGFSGVFDAIGKGNDAMKTHTQQTKAMGAAQKSAANQIASAQEAIRTANNNVRDSQDNLSEAQKNARFVQGQLSVAQQEAKRDLEDLRFAAQRASDSYIDSTLNLAEAKKRLSEAQADPKSSRLQIEQLQQQVREAGHSQAEAAVNQRRAAKDNAKAQKAGVEGSDKVIAARKAITDTDKQVLQSQRNVAEAQHDAARAQTALADAQTVSAEASSKNTTATQNYLDALKDLSPAQRDFVTLIVGMRDKFKELRNEVGEAMFPGIVSGIKLAMQNWIPFKDAIVQTAGAIGDFAEKLGRLLGDKRFGKNLKLISDSNIKVFEDLGDAAIDIAEAMSDIGVAARPMVEAIAGAIKDIADDFQRWAEAANNSGELTKFFEGTLSTLDKLWTIVKGLGGGIIGVLKALQPFGDDMLTTFGELATKFNEWANSKEGQKRIKKFFEDAKPTIEAVARAIAAIGRFLGKLSEHQGGLQRMFDFFSGSLGFLTKMIDKFPLLGDLLTAAFGFAILKKLPVLGALSRITSEKSVGIFSKIGKSLTGGGTGVLGKTGTKLGIARAAPAAAGAVVGAEGIAAAGGLAAIPAAPLLAVGAAIAAIGVASFIAYQKIKPFHDFVDQTWDGLVNVVGNAVTKIGDFFKQHSDDFSAMGKAITTVGTILLDTLTIVFNAIWPIIEPVLKFIGDTLLGTITRWFGGIIQAFSGVGEILSGIVDTIGAVLRGDFSGMWEGLKEIFAGGKDIIVGALRAMTAPIREIGARIGRALISGIRGALKGLSAVGHWIWNAIKSSVSASAGIVADVAKLLWRNFKSAIHLEIKGAFAIGRWIGDAISSAVHGIGKILESIGSRIISAIVRGITAVGSIGKDVANAVIDFLNNLFPDKIKVPGPDIPLPDNPIPRLALGGPVSGSGSGDTVRALLTPGEHVWTKGEVARAGGHSAMFAMRARLGGGGQGGNGRFQVGGAVAGAGALTIEFKGANMWNFATAWQKFFTNLVTTSRTGTNAVQKQFREMRVNTAATAVKMYEQVRKSLEDIEKSADVRGKNAASQWKGSWEHISQIVYDALFYIGHETNRALTGLGVKHVDFGLKKPGAKPERAQRGRYIRGAGSGDTVPAMLEPGEYVLNRNAVQSIGKEQLDHYNFNRAPRFQKGGGVNWGGHPPLTGAIARAVGLIEKHFPGISVSATTDGNHVTNSYHFRRMATDLSGSIPEMLKAASWIKQNMASSLLEGIHNPNLAVKDGKIYSGQGPFGDVWAGHVDHIHIALSTLGKIVDAAQQVGRATITGPGGALKSIAQGSSDLVRKAANELIGKKSATVGDTAGEAQGAEANVIAAFKRAIKASGATKVERLALWEAGIVESGLKNLQYGDADSLGALQERVSIYGRDHALDPYASATRFLRDAAALRPWKGSAGNLAAALQRPRADLRGKYDQVSDQARRYMKRGGMVGLMQMLQGGGLPTGPLSTLPTTGTGSKQRSVPIPTGSDVTSLLRKIREGTKKGKETKKSKSARDGFLRRISGLDFPQATKNALAKFAPQIDMFQTLADQADTVNNATTADKIKDAVQERTNRLGRKMNPEELAAFVGPMLQTVSGPGGQKGNPIYWLTQKVVAMGQWRNALINVAQSVKKRVDDWTDSLDPLQKRKDRLENDLKRENGKKKKDTKKIKALKAEIAAVNSLIEPTARNQQTYLDFLNTGDDGLLPNLQTLQSFPPGYVSKYDPDERVTVNGKRRRRQFGGTAFDTLSSTGLAQIPPIPPFGTLGGEILTAQGSLNTASSFGNFAVDPEPIPGAEQLGALLAEFTQAQRLQRAISAITGTTIGSFLRAPFGGSFAQGGTVPGPIGAPRMIMAHGGEVVTPFDEIQSGAATVNETHVHISGKDGWLNNIIDARVEHRTRQQAGRAQRARPGRPGAI